MFGSPEPNEGGEHDLYLMPPIAVLSNYAYININISSPNADVKGVVLRLWCAPDPSASSSPSRHPHCSSHRYLS